MSAATSDTDFDNFGAALRTGLAFASKNLGEFFEIIAFGAIGLNVSSHGGTARVDGFLHDFACGVE